MKKVLFTLAMMLTTLTASAMSYKQAREQALFLTDKMAYELDLTEEQYEAAYEVNLDYLMSITTASDVYSDYWTRRNLDLSYILFDWQYRTFCGLEYFYRPIYWGAGAWHFRIFGYYPHTHFYFGRPACFYSYHGAHAWHINGGRSWYRDRHFARHDYGMRGGWDRGGYRKMSQGWHSNDGNSRGFDRNSRPQGYRDNGNRGNIGGNHGTMNRNNGGYERNSDGNVRRDNVSGRGNLNSTRRTFDMPRGTSSSSNISGRRTFGGHTEMSRPSSTRQTVTEGSRSENRTYTPSRSFSGNSSSSQTTTRRPSNSFNRTFGNPSSSSSSRPSRSFSGSSSRSSSSSFSGGGSSRSFSGGGSSSRSVSSGSSSSRGGGHSGGGSGHFGGGRR